MPVPPYDPDSRTRWGRRSRQFRRGGFVPGAQPSAPYDGDGSAYQVRGPVAESPRLTNLEAALKVADFWRMRCIALLEENHQLKRQVVEAVAETLRIRLVMKEE